ncbi:hypothetical protein R7W79_03725, partial [Mesomycoplasma ovipneumoniae]
MILKIFTKKWVIFSIIGASLGSIAISVPLIYYALTRSVQVEINRFEPKTLTNNSKSSSIFSNSDQEKINNFILENELKKDAQNSDYALKNNFQGEYNYEFANEFLAILKITNNINQFERLKSILKTTPNFSRGLQFRLSDIYQISNIYFNSDPINNVPKLVNFISKYYDKNKKEFININDDFQDLAWNILYFKLNGHDFQKYFDIKDWIKNEFKKANFESKDVLISDNEPHETVEKKSFLLFRKYIAILTIINNLDKDYFADVIKEKQESINVLIKKWDNHFKQIIENKDRKENQSNLVITPMVSFYYFSKDFYNYSPEYLSKINDFTKNWLINFSTSSDPSFYGSGLLYYYFGNNKKIETELLKKSEEIVDFGIENGLFGVEPDITNTIFVKQILDLSEKKDNQVQKMNQTIETLFKQTSK